MRKIDWFTSYHLRLRLQRHAATSENQFSLSSCFNLEIPIHIKLAFYERLGPWAKNLAHQQKAAFHSKPLFLRIIPQHSYFNPVESSFRTQTFLLNPKNWMKPERSYSYRMLEGFLISLRWFFLLLTSTVIFHSSARLCQMHFSPPSQFFAPNFLNLPKSWTQTMPSNFGRTDYFCS